MIRVTVELISAISPDRNEILGIAEIANTGGSRTRGNYSVRLSKRGKQTAQTWRVGEVREFPRLRLGGWDLLYQAHKACVGDRQGSRRR
jgi:hypothetical protein